jgi:hypothetical protein
MSDTTSTERTGRLSKGMLSMDRQSKPMRMVMRRQFWQMVRALELRWRGWWCERCKSMRMGSRRLLERFRSWRQRRWRREQRSGDENLGLNQITFELSSWWMFSPWIWTFWRSFEVFTKKITRGFVASDMQTEIDTHQLHSDCFYTKIQIPPTPKKKHLQKNIICRIIKLQWKHLLNINAACPLRKKFNS